MLLAACRQAMPKTRPGSISGEAMNVAMALPPGTRPRTTAIAHSVPRVSEMHVARNAICTESHTAATSVSARAIAWYQRSENPDGGKENTDDGENDTATTMKIGAKRNTSTTPSTTQQNTIPKRAIVSG